MRTKFCMLVPGLCLLLTGVALGQEGSAIAVYRGAQRLGWTFQIESQDPMSESRFQQPTFPDGRSLDADGDEMVSVGEVNAAIGGLEEKLKTKGLSSSVVRRASSAIQSAKTNARENGSPEIMLESLMKADAILTSEVTKVERRNADRERQAKAAQQRVMLGVGIGAVLVMALGVGIVLARRRAKAVDQK